MPSMLPTLREHMLATDTTPSEMLSILCDYIAAIDEGQQPGPHLTNAESLIDFVVESLERGPGDCGPGLFPSAVTLARYDPRFTEQDLQQMWEGALEEGNDLGRKEIAELVMDGWDLTSCIAACTVINGEHRCDELAQILQRIDRRDEEDYITGEFLRLHDDDGDDYGLILDFAKRMGLINEDETEATELGKEYYQALV